MVEGDVVWIIILYFPIQNTSMILSQCFLLKVPSKNHSKSTPIWHGQNGLEVSPVAKAKLQRPEAMPCWNLGTKMRPTETVSLL